MEGLTPWLDLPSVETKTTFFAPLLAPAAVLKMRLLRTYCKAVPVAVIPPVYLEGKVGGKDDVNYHTLQDIKAEQKDHYP